MSPPMSPGEQRLDKWLWFARLAKSRSLAARLVSEGRVRVNRLKVTKPGRAIRVGDVLTAVIHGRLRVLRVLDVGQRRGPSREAALLYEDLAPAATGCGTAAASDVATRREAGWRRPTKRDRRRILALKAAAAEEG